MKNGRSGFSRFIAVLIASGLLAAAVSGCSAAQATDADAVQVVSAIPVQVTYAQPGDLRRETEFAGRVESGTTINLYAETTAKILNAYFNVGDTVQPDDLLLEIDPTAMQTALANAQTALASAQLTYTQSKAQMDISTSGSGYLTKTITNEKTLSDLLDNYYDTLKSKNKLNSTLDTYTCDLWKATSARETAAAKLENYAATELPQGVRTIIASDGAAFTAEGLSSSDLTAYVTDTAASAVSVRMESFLYTHPEIRAKVYTLKNGYTAVKGAATGAATAEATAKATLTAYEKQYDTSASTIDSSIRSITKNYDYYATTIGISDTLGKEETAALNKLALSMLQLSVESAQRGVDLAQDSLDKCKLHAPAAGTIIAKNAVAGNFTSMAAPMYTIAADNDLPVVAFNVSEDGAAALFVGASVTVILGAEEYPAVITELSNAASAVSGLYAAKADLPDDAEISRTGSVVKVRVSTAQADGVLTLPTNLIEYDGNTPFVYVYRDGYAKRQDLALGMSTGELAEVQSGLTAGDAIITTWHPELKDGAAVSCDALAPAKEEAAKADIEVIE